MCVPQWYTHVCPSVVPLSLSTACLSTGGGVPTITLSPSLHLLFFFCDLLHCAEAVHSALGSSSEGIALYESMKIYVENLIDCLNEKVHGYKYLYHFLFIQKSVDM